MKTPAGHTDDFSLEKIILQGTVFAPLKCSIQVETLEKDCSQKDGAKVLYNYKNCVKIPPLSMVDDILTVSKCGLQSIEMNSILNAKIESKKLRMSEDKCFHIHISKKKSKCTTDLKVHDSVMKKSSSAVYVGDVLSETASINETVRARETKSIGLINQISVILQNVNLGIFHFRTALVLRESMFLNGILTSCESWNYLTEKNLKILYDADIRMFSNIFSSSLKINHCLYFLETGKLPIRHVIAKRRLMFYHHILSRDDNEVIKQVYSAQRLKPVRQDWVLMIDEEKRKYDINLHDEEVQCLSKSKFRNIVNKSVNKFAFKSLLTKARSQTKCLKIVEQLNEVSIKIQKYLLSDEMTREEQNLCFILRCHSFLVKSNYKTQFGEDMSCRGCHDPDSYEDEIHLTKSCRFLENERGKNVLEFNDVFGSLRKQIEFIKKFKLLARKWNLMLELQKNHQ